MDKDTYFAEVECFNCGKKAEVEVDRGRMVKEHIRLKSELCKNCNFRLK